MRRPDGVQREVVIPYGRGRLDLEGCFTFRDQRHYVMGELPKIILGCVVAGYCAPTLFLCLALGAAPRGFYLAPRRQRITDKAFPCFFMPHNLPDVFSCPLPHQQRGPVLRIVALDAGDLVVQGGFGKAEFFLEFV